MKPIANFFKFRSFANRLSWRLVLTLTAVMGFALYVLYHFTWAVINAETDERCEDITATTANDIDQILVDVRQATLNNVANIKVYLNRPNQIHNLLKRALELNPNLQSFSISFVENYYPQKGKWFAPYARRDSVGNITTGYAGDMMHDYLHEADFQKALTTDSAFWTKPYVDHIDRVTPLVSYMQPIHDHTGRIAAIIVSDLSLNSLKKKLTETEKKLNWFSDNDSTLSSILSHCFIIDRDGVYISHPDTTRILKDNYFDYAKKQSDTLALHAGHLMLAGKKGSYSGGEEQELKLDGKSIHLFYAPTKEVDWSLAIAVNDLNYKLIGYVFVTIILVLLILALIVVFFMSFFGIRRAVKPLKTLAKATEEVAQGKFDTPLPKIKSHDEIRLLRDSFEEMQHSLTKYIDQLQTTTAQKATMESELKIAHNIQMSMLPKTFPPYPQRQDVDIYGMLTPAKAVGGDLFDFYIRDEQLFFCIGDVSGKGVPASLVMAVSRSLFRNISAHTSSTSAIVGSINDAMVEGNETGMFVTLFVGVLDLQSGSLRYCNGGHNAPLVISNDVQLLPCKSNLVVGIIPNHDYEEQQTTIQHGTTLFLFTDGLNEAEDAHQAQFGDERVNEVAEALIQDQVTNPNDVIERMQKAVHQFVGTAEQSDDLTMMAIRYN